MKVTIFGDFANTSGQVCLAVSAAWSCQSQVPQTGKLDSSMIASLIVPELQVCVHGAGEPDSLESPGMAFSLLSSSSRCCRLLLVHARLVAASLRSLPLLSYGLFPFEYLCSSACKCPSSHKDLSHWIKAPSTQCDRILTR